MKRIAITFVLAAVVAFEANLPYVPTSVSAQYQAASELAYHDSLQAEPLPPTVDPMEFTTDHKAFVAYALAARIKPILYQVPCYCGCAREQGHRSLLDCFTGRHGIRCHMCQREVIFCYLQHEKGEHPSQIRDAMARGKAFHIDVEKYTDRLYAEMASQK